MTYELHLRSGIGLQANGVSEVDSSSYVIA